MAFESFKQVSLSSINALNNVRTIVGEITIPNLKSLGKSPLNCPGQDVRHTWCESPTCVWEDETCYKNNVAGHSVVVQNSMCCGKGFGYGYWNLYNTNYGMGFNK